MNWRLICVPNLAYAAVAIWLLLRYFPDLPVTSSERPTDWLGIILIVVTLVSLQIILSRGQIDDWFGSPRIRMLAWLGATALILLAIWQTSPRNPPPLLGLELLFDRYVLSSALIGIFTGMILSGSLYMLPKFLRNVASHPLSATQTGRVMAA